MKTIRLREGRERALQRRHPWVFEGAVQSGKADSGETVRIEAHDGAFLAWAAYSPSSTIRARVWSFDAAERIDGTFFERRIAQALALRRRLPIDGTGVRLIHGEADGVPGLVVDRYGDTLCAQFLAAGVERWKRVLTELLLRCSGVQRLYERSDASVRAVEGLPPVAGWLHGAGDTEVAITEHGHHYTLDVASGHKTGFYLDQRDNRLGLRRWVRQLGCRRVLNGYCYSGGFTLEAFAGGAEHVVSVDSSAAALDRARLHLQANGYPAGAAEWIDADMNRYLRECIEQGRRFDAIVLDPPKLAPSAAHAERAARAYKDINRLAFKVLEPGGLLITFSCSGAIGADLFHKIVAAAGIDAAVDGYFVERLEAACDHPSTVTFPEGAYLKGLAVLRR